ncbi:hypothetical protein FACS189441_7650 [Betaproteobacteria bacterium]|nr:hypothetical protein FACS189441_7650 [Betaproteobacteria bacterium]
MQQEIDSARSAFEDVSKTLSDSVTNTAAPCTDEEIQEEAPSFTLPAALPFDTDVSCPIDQTRPVA